MNQICINEQPVEIKEWRGQRVVTFKDVDRVHQRADGTARRNFNTNKERFIENADFFAVSRKELRTKFVRNTKDQGNPNIQVILLTEMGYLMLVKSFTDDLAWKVQRALVNNYFRGKKPVQQQLPVTPQRYLFNGVPVMLAKDIAQLIGCDRRDLHLYMDKQNQRIILTGDNLKAFKEQNHLHSNAAKQMIFYWPTAEAVLRKAERFEQNEAFLREYFTPEHSPLMSDEEMRLAVKQADILYRATFWMKDDETREAALFAVTKLLINIGLWDDRHYGYNGATSNFALYSAEGWNKDAIMRNANKRWAY